MRTPRPRGGKKRAKRFGIADKVEKWKDKQAERLAADQAKSGRLDLATTSPDDPRVSMMQEGWEEVIFINADHFRLHRFYGRGHQDRAEVKTWPDALRLATEELDKGKRVLVYAITASGRSTVCVDNRWDYFSELWEKYCASTKGR